MTFELKSTYQISGDQGAAIEGLIKGIESGADRLTLLGVTGSGKTFTMANVVARLNRPTLILSPNKTLAAQLFAEFKGFFPSNAVEYFVSYYDYYQPEAYIPQSDTYIDKDAMINERIDRLRLAATTSLLSRRDALVVASISCIYGLGAPSEYMKMSVTLKRGETVPRDRVVKRLVEMQYSRGEDLERGTMRVRGDTLDVHASYREDAYRITWSGDEIEGLYAINPLTGNVTAEFKSLTVFAAKHFVQSQESINAALKRIEEELKARYAELKGAGKILEAERILQRTNFDLEMIRELGYCSGIENYSRHLTGRAEGEPPYTLLDYFPSDLLVFIDESHVAASQIEGMYNGDRARKQTLVDFGFRLPSALDNRPLKGAEFHARVPQIVFVSATPGAFERKVSKVWVEQLVRPTGLVDPEIEIRPATGQVDDLRKEIDRAIERGERVLVTTLTKRTSEELTTYLEEKGYSVGYLHSEIKTLERIEILKSLRTGDIDVLIGINLLREGLDLPEVALVAILDADREGFLRSETSLIQTMGRAARNLTGRVILYADTETGSMKRAIEETRRRREVQLAYNERMGITPQSISKPIDSLSVFALDPFEEDLFDAAEAAKMPEDARELLADTLRREMDAAAEVLDFEKAAYLRDKIETLTGRKRGKKSGRKSRR
jgi:excinuclease ABC subunit B